MAPTVFFHLSSRAVRAGETGSALPTLQYLLRDMLELQVAIVIDDVVSAVDPATTGRLTVKVPSLPTGDVLLLDAAWAVVGENEATRYIFTVPCDSETLREALGDAESLKVTLQLELDLPEVDQPVLSLPFPATIVNAWSRGDEDVAPPAHVPESEAWLTARAVRFDRAQTLTDEQKEQARGNIGAGVGGGSSTIGDITGLQEALDELGTEIDGKAPAVHSHVIGDIIGLQTALNSKAASVHGHLIGDIAGLQVALDGKAASIHTHAIGDVTGLQAALDGKAVSSHTHADASTGTAGFMAAAMVIKLAAQQAATSIASATATNIGGLAEVVTITAVASPITSFGAGTEGERHLLVFAGVVTMNHSAALSLPGAANFTTQAGDRLTIRGTSAGWAVDPIYVRGGVTTMIGAVNASGGITAASHLISTNGDVFASSSGALGWTGLSQMKSLSNGTADLTAANGTTMGTLRAAGVTGRPVTGSNAAGQNFAVSGGIGAGTGPPGNVTIRAAPPGSSGSTAHVLRDQSIVNHEGSTVRAGQGSDFYRVAGNRYCSETIVSQDQIDTDQILHQVTITAGTLSRIGDRLEVTAEMECSLGSDTGTWRLYAGATLFCSFSTSSPGLGRVEITLRRIDAGTLRYWVKEILPPGGLTPTMPLNQGAISADLTADFSLTVTGQSASSSMVYSHLLCVDFFPVR